MPNNAYPILPDFIDFRVPFHEVINCPRLSLDDKRPFFKKYKFVEGTDFIIFADEKDSDYIDIHFFDPKKFALYQMYFFNISTPGPRIRDIPPSRG